MAAGVDASDAGSDVSYHSVVSDADVSEAIASGEEAADGGEAAVAPEPAAPAPVAALEVGFVTYARAPTGKAKCMVCDTAIAKGVWRFEVRLKGLYVRKCCHFHCAKDLPEELRERNLRRLSDFLLEPELPADVIESLERVVSQILGPSGASASAG